MSRTQIIVIGSVSGALLLALVALLLLFVLRKEPAPIPASDGTTFPGSGGASQTTTVRTERMLIPIQSGSLEVNDFLHNGETIPDVASPGNFVLAGDLGYCLADGTCPHGAVSDDFAISYIEKDGTFAIVLLREPLGAARRAAEEFLASRLGVPEDRLCYLNYYLGTPYFVNSVYSDRNLGFSICPDATNLP